MIEVNSLEPSTEIVLADSFTPEKVKESIGASVIQSSLTMAKSTFTEVSLPAALCDELLIQEITQIPDKMGFKIGEVAEMLGLKQYVLRYWETEFEVLKPKKADNKQRYYTRKEVETAFLIRKLLHRDRFSIEGAKSAMKELKNFVKVEVRKERDLNQYNERIDSVVDRVDELVGAIRRLRSSINNSI